ncbi:WD40-repeat-containing domain protein [Chaetomium tenue]|uniref:WD40-repeat-containing domain protein n=1 Tax=Chaetomium tenue TaxID=1854479 RepID=A0ACB7PFY9_9PEZI|nr:WD40-repeat-containing domain protein [Chaetomium globosum]
MARRWLTALISRSVLPPPPRYPSGTGYNGLPAGTPMPMIETNNVLSNPSGPEYQFLVGEGLYVLKDDLHLATPPPHPSEAPLVNPNPLATAPQPATAGTRLTLLNLDVNPQSPAVYRTSSRSDGAQGSIQENQDESQSSTDVRESSSDAGRISSTEAPPLARANTNTPAFGEGNTLLAPVVQKDPSKRRKPKNNMTKSNSSFISRVINHETLPKRLQERARDGLFGFANINRAFQWLDLSSPAKSAINGTPVSQIEWIPGSENLFLAAHMDVHSKNQKLNPVSVWKLSNHRINAFAFSPDSQHLAVVSEDGTLRIIDYLKEELLDLHYAYYGGLSCVCWSPDGKYVVTGGQDDLISIWCPSEAPALVARCQGHHSWVTSVAFDPWRCDERNYRFGSVGEDGRICLWDFSVGMLHRPRAASVRQRGSISSRPGAIPLLHRAETAATAGTSGSGRLRSDSNLSSAGVVPADGEKEKVLPHPVAPRATTATLPPVLSKTVDDDVLCWLGFTPDAIITSCKTGHIRTWTRPSELAQQLEEKKEDV